MEKIEELDWFMRIKVIAAGKSFGKVLKSFHKLALFTLNRPACFPYRPKENSTHPIEVLEVADHTDAEILKFISNADWLFVIADIEYLNIAEKVATCIKEVKTYLTTFIILCPSAEDARLKDINFGTQIILPEDKIAESGLTNDEAIYQVVDKITCTQSLGIVMSMDFEDISNIMGNTGRAYVGLGKSLGTLQAAQNALKSPLLIEDISKAKNILLVFVRNSESLNMLEANGAVIFFVDNIFYNEVDILYQVVIDDTADGVTAFILATNF